VLPEVRHPCAHLIERTAANQTRAPDASRDGPQHDVGRRLSGARHPSGGQQSGDLSLVSHQDLADDAEPAGLPKQEQRWAVTTIHMDDER